jgi:hypothetical protein
MTFEQVLQWCRDNGADARGIYRARDFWIRRSDRLPDDLPAIGALFHWDVRLDDTQLAVSPSDMERMINGKMTLEQFKATHRRG